MQSCLFTRYTIGVLVDSRLETTFRHAQIPVNGVEGYVIAPSSTASHSVETTTAYFDMYRSRGVLIGVVGGAQQLRRVFFGYRFECGNRCGKDSNVDFDYAPVHRSRDGPGRVFREEHTRDVRDSDYGRDAGANNVSDCGEIGLKGVTYKRPSPSIMPRPTFCLSGICNLRTKRKGRIYVNKSVRIVNAALAK
jgi:hypothetical protein